MTDSQKPTVGFPLYEGVTLLDFAGATQIFGFAAGFNYVWLSKDKQPEMTYWSQHGNLRLLSDKLKIDAPAGYPRYVIDYDRKRWAGLSLPKRKRSLVL